MDPAGDAARGPIDRPVPTRRSAATRHDRDAPHPRRANQWTPAGPDRAGEAAMTTLAIHGLGNRRSHPATETSALGPLREAVSARLKAAAEGTAPRVEVDTVIQQELDT